LGGSESQVRVFRLRGRPFDFVKECIRFVGNPGPQGIAPDKNLTRDTVNYLLTALCELREDLTILIIPSVPVSLM
jgi:hypothetical protein